MSVPALWQILCKQASQSVTDGEHFCRLGRTCRVEINQFTPNSGFPPQTMQTDISVPQPDFRFVPNSER